MTWSNTYYLKAETETKLKEALPEDWLDDEGNIICYSEGHALDLIGDLVTAPAETDKDGNIISEAVVYEGYHANLKLNGVEIPDGLVPLQVTVSSPSRMFA